MATKIVTKNSSTAGAAPTATDLVQGELAVNVADKRLFTEDNGGAIVELGTNPYNFTANHNGSAKLATTSTGIDVTGTVVANDLTLGDSSPTLNFNDSDIANLNHYITSASNANLYYAADSAAVATGKHVFTTQNVERFEINSTGIDVTGTATMDGLTVDGDGSFKTGSGAVLTVGTTNASAAAGQVVGQITFDNADISGNKANAEIRGMAHDAFGRTNIDFRTGDSGSLKTRALVSWKGDISFYEDTGTTPKFFWDASAESLGIGTSSPSAKLDVAGTVNAYGNGSVALQWGDTSALGSLSFDGSANPVIRSASSKPLVFQTNGANERMRIDASGNVKQNSVNTSTNVGYSVNNGTYDAIALGTGGFGVNGGAATDGGIRAYNNLLFGTGASATERLRIDSSGNVGIGTSSPVSELDVAGITPTLTIKDTQNKSWTSSDTTLGELAFRISDASGIGAHNVAFVRAVNDITSSSTPSGALSFGVAPNNSNASEAMRIDSSGNVGIGRTPTSHILETAGEIKLASLGANQGIDAFNTSSVQWGIKSTSASDAGVAFEVGNTERMRIDSSGNMLVGKGATNTLATVGHDFGVSGYAMHTRNSSTVLYLNRNTTDGAIQEFFKDGTTVGSIGTVSSGGSQLAIANVNTGLCFRDNQSAILPSSSTTLRDNVLDLGNTSFRFDDIYATNGTIQTSDRNEKQDIAELSDAEQRVAVACKGLTA